MLPSEDTSPASSPRISRLSTPGTEIDLLFSHGTDNSPPEKFVLVTGGLGFIGSHTAVELLKDGYNVIIVDDLSNSFQDVYYRILTIAKRHFDAVGGRCPRAELHNIDYRDGPAMNALLASHSVSTGLGQTPQSRIIGVVHFAAFKAVEESTRKPLKYYRNNINGLVDLMCLLETYNIKTIIFSSSAVVYGTLADGSQLLREEHCVHEVETYEDSNLVRRTVQQGCTGITSPYGRTKFLGEAILSDLAISDASWNIVGLRYFNPVGCDASGLLGEDPRGVPSNLLPVVAKVLIGEYEELAVYGNDWSTPDGTAIRDFIHVSDLARGHTAALAATQSGRIGAGFRTFNIGTGAGSSVLEVVAAMESASGQSIRTKIVDRRAGDVQASVAAADRAKHELGWESKESLSGACRDLWNYMQLRGAA